MLLNQCVCWLAHNNGLVVKLDVYHLMAVFWSKFHPPNILEYSYIDQNLTWQNHIDYVLRRVRGKIYSINHHNPPSTIKNLLYQVYILLTLDYCDVIWAPTNAKQTRHLHRLPSKYTSSCTDLFISRWPLINWHKYHTVR